MKSLIVVLGLVLVGGCTKDEDGDGFEAGVDCDDSDPYINPDAIEVCDEVDNDCNGQVDDDAINADTWYEDSDGDDYGAPEVSVKACEAPSGYVDDYSDCDDGNAEINPERMEVCDGVDNDCNGSADVGAVDATTFYADDDGDGYGDPDDEAELCEAEIGYVTNYADCDDGDDRVHPGANERCDGVDNDCDSTTDEGCTGPTEDCDNDMDDDGDGLVDCEDDDCDADPNCTGGIEPYAFFVGGSFGYRASAARAVPYEVDGVEVDPYLEMEVASEDYFDTGDDRYMCTAVWTYEGALSEASWVSDAGVWFGMEMPSSAIFQTDCVFSPTSTWGDPEDLLTSFDWGLGIGPMDSDVQTALESAVGAAWETDWEPYVMGGGFYWSLLEDYGEPGGYAPYNYVIAYEVDEDMVLLDTSGDPYDGSLDPAMLDAATSAASLETGVYSVGAFYGVDATYLLE